MILRASSGNTATAQVGVFFNEQSTSTLTNVTLSDNQAPAGTGGGIYTWKTLEAAHRGHDEAFRARIRDTFGGDAEFAYFETPIVVDNEHNA